MSAYLGGLPLAPMFDKLGNFLPAWSAWFAQMQAIGFATSSSGATSARPTSNLWVGRFYFDTTLGIPIWCKTPATPIWVNASGTPV
jgi:hypothetical protein